MQFRELKVGELYAADCREVKGRDELRAPTQVTVVRYLGESRWLTHARKLLDFEVVEKAQSEPAREELERRFPVRDEPNRPVPVLCASAALILAPWDGYHDAYASQQAVERGKRRSQQVADREAEALEERLRAAGLPAQVWARQVAHGSRQQMKVSFGEMDVALALRIADALQAGDSAAA